MGIDIRLVDRLVCPQTRAKLAVASTTLVEELNGAIAKGTVKNQGGQTVADALEAGLVRADGKVLYPIRDGIPCMFDHEAIPLDD